MRTIELTKQELENLLKGKEENKMTLNEFLNAVNGEESNIINFSGDKALEAVKQDRYALRYVKNQTEAICLEAVKKYGYALQYVKDQTEAICLEAVKQNGYVLQYVKDQTEAICLEAVKQDMYALRYVDKSIFRNKLDSLEKIHDDYVNINKQLINDIKSILFNKSVNNDDKIEFVKKIFKEMEK